jgi:hypothetical protein
MKKLSMVIMTVLGIVSLGIFAGCADTLNPRLQEESAGTGRALIRIGTRAEGARTLMPENTENYAALSYTLTFTPVSGYGVETNVSLEGGGEAAVDLEAGTWNLAVTGYKNGTAVLEGSASNIEVRSGETTPVSVAMKIKTEGGDGTLSYAVTFPDAVLKGWLRVYGWEDGTLARTVDLLETSPSGGGTKTKSGELTLSGGYYRLGIDLYTANGVLNWSDIAHVYPGQTTAMGTDYAVFETGDFAATDIHTETSLAAVLSGISGLSDGADRVYVLGAGDESMAPVSVSPADGSVSVTIDGGGRAVSLSGSGSLITVGSGVTLTLKNITLRGKGQDVDNAAALITVNTGGTLELNDGVVITGNRNYHSDSDSYGGGVYVEDNGTLTMNGGVISGNSAYSSYPSSSYGGGVYVGDGGTLTMNGGVISGNTSNTLSYDDYGGGVYVGDGGTFTMSDGIISDNIVNNYGGGVSVGDGGTFIMDSGVISGNSADTSGGGVSVGNGGTFIMDSGKISDNTSLSNSSGVYVRDGGTFTMNDGEISDNTGASGGGVEVEDGGTFTMNGGEISGNTAFYGGGVYVGGGMYDGGTFIMNGGKISGNTAAAFYGENYSGAEGGGVVFWSGIFIMNGGEISGNTVYHSTPATDPLFDHETYAGGGVYIGTGTFTKKGGTIYGDADAIAGNGNVTDNTATSGKGHAIYLRNSTTLRNSTAGPAVTLYVKRIGGIHGGTWTFNDTSAGGVGDTTGNWETNEE